MSDFDEDTPYEDLPGVIAYELDGDFYAVGAGTDVLGAINLAVIGEAIDEQGGSKAVPVDFLAGQRVLTFDSYINPSAVLSEIDGVVVEQDTDAGFSSAQIYFLDDNADATTVEHDIRSLAAALKEAFPGS